MSHEVITKTHHPADSTNGHENFECKRQKFENLFPASAIQLSTGFTQALSEIREVVENVLWFVDFNTLLTARFVCKLWNEEACRILQHKSYVSLSGCDEDESLWEEFSELYLTSCKTGAPTPFRSCSVTGNKLTEKLDAILNYPGLSLYEMHLGSNYFPLHRRPNIREKMFRIFAKHSQSIEVLRFVLDKPGELSDEEQRKWSSLKFPALKNFGFTEFYQRRRVPRKAKTACVQFICDIMDNAPNLVHFSPGTSFQDDLMFEIIRRADWRNIKDLYLEQMTKQHHEIFTALPLPHLQNLMFNPCEQTENEHRVPSETLQALVANFSATLKVLDMTWVSDTPDLSFPSCPLLKKLRLRKWMGSCEFFNPKNMPMLRDVELESFNTNDIENFGIDPHPGVEILRLEVSLNDFPNAELTDGMLEEEYAFFLEYFSRQFPCVKTLDLKMPLSTETIAAAIRHFPNIRELILDTNICPSEHIFTGLNRKTLNRMIANGFDLNDGVRTTSLLDLKFLRILVLGREGDDEGMLTNNAIQYGIAKMAELKILQMTWCSDLSVDIVAASLSHLDAVVIPNARDLSDKTCEELESRIPNVEFSSHKFDKF